MKLGYFIFLLFMQRVGLHECLPLPQDNGITKPKDNDKARTGIVKSAADYLARYGYATKDFADSDPTESSMKDFLTNFQAYADIPLTGRLDNTTIAKMEEPRCGMKDPKIKIKVKRRKRYVLFGTSWKDELGPGRTLTWKVLNSGTHFDMTTVRRIMYYALQKWSNAANINFQEVLTGNADILVSFRPGYHGDPWAFDGRGGTLAHAFYPYPGQESSGDIHFDDDEQFTFGKSYGTDVLWVAVHEAGHSLGLEHSRELDAVMYPWYSGSKGKDFDLRPDDIAGVQVLYGSRLATEGPTSKPTDVASPTLSTIEPNSPETSTTSTQQVKPPTSTTDPLPPGPQTTKSTELVRPPIPTTDPIPPEPPTTKSTELVRTPIATTDPVPPEPPTTHSTEAVKPPISTTDPVPPDPQTTKSTELVRPPLPTTDPLPPDPQTTKSTEAVKPPIATTDPVPPDPQTTKSTEAVKPPNPTTDPVPPDPQTTKSTEAVKPPITTTDPVPSEPPKVMTTISTDLVTSSFPTAEVPTTPSMKDELCPSQIEAAVILASGWLVVFSGNSFYLVSRRGKEYGPIRVKDYFPGLNGRVSAAYRRKDDGVVLFVANKYYVYKHFRLIEEAQPVENYGLPAETKVDAALVWPGNKFARWRQGDKIYLFSGTMYYRYDTRRRAIDRAYPKVISKLWRGLPSKVNAAFSGTLRNNWKTHFFSNSQFYLFNDRRVRTYSKSPESLQMFLKC